jgi:uncharacterized membrane protein
MILSIPLGILNISLIDPPVLSMLALTLIAITPLVIDGLTQYYGLRMSNNHLRAITGLVAGIGSGIALPFILWRFALAIF